MVPDALKAEALRLRLEGRSIRAIAAELGVSASRVQRWVPKLSDTKPAPKSTRKRKPKLHVLPEPKPNLKGMSREDYLTLCLEDTHADLEAMRAGESWQALAATRRVAISIREELDRITAGRNEEFDGDSLEALVAEVAELPDEVFTHAAILARVAECN